MRTKTVAGFTLIELVVVIAVMGVMVGAVAVTFGSALAAKRVEGIVQEVMLSLRLANQKSVFQQKKQDFVIDFRNNKYWIEVLEPGKGKRSKKLRRRATETRELSGRFKFLLVFYLESEDTEKRKKSRLTFYPDGTTDDAVILIGRENISSRGREYDYLEAIKIRGTDAKVTLLDEEDKEWYEAYL